MSIVTIHVCQPQAVVLILGFQQLTDKPEQILLELKYRSQNNVSTDSSLLQIYKPYRNSLGLWILIFHLITLFSRLNFQKLESMRRLWIFCCTRTAKPLIKSWCKRHLRRALWRACLPTRATKRRRGLDWQGWDPTSNKTREHGNRVLFEERHDYDSRPRDTIR